MGQGLRRPVRVEYEGFAITTRPDCRGRPLEAIIELRGRRVGEGTVAALSAGGARRDPFPGFCVVDRVGYYRLGFSLGGEEIHVTYRQNHHPDAPQTILQALRAWLAHEGG